LKGLPKVEEAVRRCCGRRCGRRREVGDRGGRPTRSSPTRGAARQVLDFLTTTDVGRMVPREGVGGEEDRGSEMSEGELREQVEVEEGDILLVMIYQVATRVMK